MTKIETSAFVPGYATGVLDLAWKNKKDLSASVIVINSPSIDEILSLDSSRPAGIILIGGIRLSHLAIFLCSLRIPTVLAPLSLDLSSLSNRLAYIDGSDGRIIVDPDKSFQDQWNADIESKEAMSASAIKKVVSTLDDEPIVVAASISSAKNASDAITYGADEVGLLRSEFLFGQSSDPKIGKTYLAALQAVCKAATPLRIKVRLFDLGGEKIFRWAPTIPDSDKTLGVRGARLYKYEEFSSLFRSQVESIAQLSSQFDLGVLIPFISNPSEFAQLRRRIDDVAKGTKLTVGAMIETPSACLSIPELATMTDFIALGTNDLMQCFFAADRSLSASAAYLDAYSPSLYRFLAHVARDAQEYKMPIQVCGQLPLYPYTEPLLIGLGFHNFSVEPYAIPSVKKFISQSSTNNLKSVAESALRTKGSNELKALLSEAFR